MGTPNKLSQQVDETGAAVQAEVLVDPNTPANQLKINSDGSMSETPSVGGNPISPTNPEPVDEAALQGPISVTVTSPLTANQDNSITFSSKVRTVLMHNQSAVNVPYEHDQVAVAVSPYLAPGQLVYVDVHTTVLHIYPSNALPVNAANGLIVRGWA